MDDLGATILRSGLSAALAGVERRGDRGCLVLEHLASAEVPGLEGATAADFARRVRALDVDGYILATREMMAVVTWLKRAVQAMFEEE